MELEKITPVEQRKLNRNNIYQFIRNAKNTSKKDIADSLQLSLPTVTQNLKELEAEGLVIREGLYDSSCGRKAQIIACNPTAFFAIGVEVLKEEINIVAVDLMGTQIRTLSMPVKYFHESTFYEYLGKQILLFSSSLGCQPRQIIGVAVALQGLISLDGQDVVYGMVMNNTGAKLSSISEYVPFPCRIVHDAKAAAFTELWFRKIRNAFYIGLNHNVGSAAIVDGQIQYGVHARSGAIEHMCIVPHGRQCYCGRHGCMEMYCSGDNLEHESGLSIDAFFKCLHKGDETCNRIWQTYLEHLAFTIDNIRFVLDSPIVLGGTISNYLTEGDIAKLFDLTQPASFCELDILRGICNHYPSATGGALMLVHDFIKVI